MDQKFNNLKEEVINPSSSSYSSLSSLSATDSAFLETVLVDNSKNNRRHNHHHHHHHHKSVETNEIDKRKKKLEKTRLLLNSSPNHDENANMLNTEEEICCEIDETTSKNNNINTITTQNNNTNNNDSSTNLKQFRSTSLSTKQMKNERPARKKRSKTKEAARVGNLIKDETRMCCSKKFGCIALFAMYVCFDALVNLFFVTNAFAKYPSFQDLNFKTLIYDVWLISLTRDLLLLIVLFIVGIKHRIIYNLIRFVHKKYLSAFLCLLMYSYSMAKMLLHADEAHQKQIKSDQTNMFMFIWNIISAFFFFIAWYMLALLKVKDSNYRQTAVDGGDMGDNPEEDIFLETLKETKKKRPSLLRLFKYSSPDLTYILIGTLFLLLGAICEAFVPYYTGQVLDAIMVKQDFVSFKANAIFFIAAHFLSGMLGGLRTCMFSIAVSRLNVRLRKLVFKALIEQDIGFFDKVKTGDMLSRLSADTTTMSDLISQNLNGFLWNLVKTIGTLIFILKLSWQLSLTCFIGAPIVFSVGKLYGNYYRKLSNKVQKCMADANHVAEESLSTIRTVRSFANEDGEMQSYSNKLRDMLKFKIKQAIVFTTYDWGVRITELCMTISMLTFGAYLVVSKQIASGDFMSFVIYQLTLSTCLEGLTSVYTGLMSAAGASEKIFEYLDIKPTLQINRPFEPDNFQGEIQFNSVQFAYPTRLDVPVLSDISFTVKPGEVVALVGPSGSGKSSCVSLLERFYKPIKGEILIDGIQLADYNHKFIHRKIALVGQEPVLYARKIKDNIAYALEDECIDEQVHHAARMANAHGFIMETPAQYDTECGERGTQLSGGQKQRIAIARALIRNPRILLLDEATSALDAESEYLVQQAIHKNLKGHTVIVVAHRLSTIENADKIIVLDHGKIVEQGNHKELLRKNGLYAYLVKKQMHGEKDNESIVSKSGASTPSLANLHQNRYQDLPNSIV